MDLSVSPKAEIWFLRVCHHISTGLYHEPVPKLNHELRGDRSANNRVKYGTQLKPSADVNIRSRIYDIFQHILSFPLSDLFLPTHSGVEVYRRT